MERYIPVDKLSKKRKKAYYAAKRGSWNGVNPVSRQVPSKKIYNRKQAKMLCLFLFLGHRKNALCGSQTQTTQRMFAYWISPSSRRLRRIP